MRDLKIHQGESIREKVMVDEADAVTAEFIATDGVTNIIEITANFVGLAAYLNTNQTIVPVGSYDYYYRITWGDGSIDILPDTSNCEGNCTFPQLIVCEVPGVS
jgi:hypothetical protein